MENSGQRLARVSTNKEFLDELSNMITPPKNYDDDQSEQGRLRELKTFMLESDDGFPLQAKLERMSYEVTDTGLDWIKILTVTEEDHNHQFYLDVSDKRFFQLHTNHKSDTADRIIRALTGDRNHTLDNTWLYHDMLKRLAVKPNNYFHGFDISYSNTLVKDDDLENLTMSIRGSMASEVEDLIRTNDRLNKAGAYDKVSISRGSGADPYERVQDDVHNNGYFAVKYGKSVQEHLHIVDYCREEYSKTVLGVENERIGVRDVDGERFLDGNSFYFEFPNRLVDLDAFIDRVFDSTRPFQLWGLKQQIRDGYYKILAVDLHTGSPMDFEIADDMMRAYIFKGSCGNTILRLLTNLQIYFDSQTRCPMVDYIACK